MTPRRALVAAVAAASVGAGGGWAWWRQRQSPATPSARRRPEVDEAAPVDVWSLRFERPEGGELAVGSFKGSPLLLNFWATWCPPCVEEMPLLDRFQREAAGKGWHVLGLAVDSAGPVREFLAKRPVGFPIGLAGLQGVDLARSLGNGPGGLPFSVIFNRRGEPVQRSLGPVKFAELLAWVGQLG